MPDDCTPPSALPDLTVPGPHAVGHSRYQGESMRLGDDGYVVFVSQLESHHAIRAFHRPGGRGALHASSLGKAIMASLPEKAVTQILHRVGMKKFTDRTIVDPQALLAELALVRKRGWAQSGGITCSRR